MALKGFSRALACFVLLFSYALCVEVNNEPDDISDLWRFVTRPDLMPPKLNITYYDESAKDGGYWFLGPYPDLLSRRLSRIHTPAQCGPTIYDTDGELVWSGSNLLLGYRATFDFRVSKIKGVDYLTFIVHPDGENDNRVPFDHGSCVIFDNTYNFHKEFINTVGNYRMNMHEFNVVEDGKSLLYIIYGLKVMNHTDLEGWTAPEIYAGNNGFAEVDMESGNTTREWWGLDHFDVTENVAGRWPSQGLSGHAWDFLHVNAADKTPEGDYLMSARYADTIYKISHVDGEILWRLGGPNTSFVQENFNFSRQHDVRFRSSEGSKTVISFLDNASDDTHNTSRCSKAMFVEVDESTMHARALHVYERPDGQLSRLRGNVQKLPNGNVFVGWSANGVISEFAEEGKLLMHAEFPSTRFATYRAYKFPWVGQPEDDPVTKMFTYGESSDSSVTVFYMSWNGATEVAKWRCYGTAKLGDTYQKLGEGNKAGFETSLAFTGHWKYGYVEAIDKHGNAIGRSDIEYAAIGSSGVIDAAAGMTPGSSIPRAPTFLQSMAAGAIGMALVHAFVWFWKSRTRRTRIEQEPYDEEFPEVNGHTPLTRSLEKE